MDGDRPVSGDASNTSTDDAFVFPAEDTGEQDPNASLPTSGLKQRVVDAVNRYYETESDLDLPVPTREAIRDQYFEWSYLDRVTAIEHYWLNRPHAFASIVYDPEARAYRYLINEVGLDAFESYVRTDLTEVLRDVLLYREVDATSRERVFQDEVVALLAEYGDGLDATTLRKLQYYLQRDFVGYAELDPLMHDTHIEDISCVGPDLPVFVYHEHYRDLRTSLSFEDERLSTFVTRLAQRIELGTISLDMATYLWLAVQHEMDTLFVGGTASGKTTTMNASAFFVPPNSKVISIEDTREITLPHDNWIQSLTRDATGGEQTGIGMYRLLRAGLRQRPEYLLVGEIRTDPDVALTFFQAIASGHTGFSTFHADSVETAIDRLTNDPLAVPEQMVRALDVIVLQRQSFLGSRRVRRVNEVVELGVAETDTNTIEPRTIYRWDVSDDTFEQVNEPQLYHRIRDVRDWSAAHLEDEFETRRTLLQYLVESDVDDHRAIAGVLHTFVRDPESVVPELQAGTLDPTEYV